MRTLLIIAVSITAIFGFSQESSNRAELNRIRTKWASVENNETNRKFYIEALQSLQKRIENQLRPEPEVINDIIAELEEFDVRPWYAGTWVITTEKGEQTGDMYILSKEGEFGRGSAAYPSFIDNPTKFKISGNKITGEHLGYIWTIKPGKEPNTIRMTKTKKVAGVPRQLIGVYHVRK